MIRGKYLRERKAIRVKRRIKLLIALAIVFILYKIIFSSYSLYESQANSNANVDVAFYCLEDEYQTETITLKDMIPDDTNYQNNDTYQICSSQTCTFSVSNFYQETDEETGEKTDVISETDMECDIKIRTTTNLPLEYELYIDQDESQGITVLDATELKKGHWDDDGTIFKYLVKSTASDEDKANGITDTIDFSYNQASTRTYTLKITFPKEYKNYEYSNIIECIEITVDSHQVIEDETTSSETTGS